MILLGLLGMSVNAQEVTGTIAGTVTDATGAAVPGVSVTVTESVRQQILRKLVTNADGGYVATLLPVGTYTVRAEIRGFRSANQTGVELHVSDKLTVNFAIAVGDAAEQVTVEASPVAVDLQSATSAGLISGTEVTELSLNNRNYVQLIALMPGVTSNAATDEMYIGTTNPTGGTNTIPFSIGGGRTSGNNFMVDGADNVDRGSNLTLLNYPSVDAIAEFKALRGQYSAEYGRGASGMINVITKSGGSKFHASAYEFFKNDRLSANNFFNNARKIARPPLRYNNFGYTFSGPVPFLSSKDASKHKTFFFWSQEFRRVITYSTFQALAPNDDMKRGVFKNPVCVDFTVNVCNATASQISNINPVAAAYLQGIWSKVPAGDSLFNLFSVQSNIYNHRQELVKIDHTFTPSQTVSLRYIKDTIPTEEPGGLFTGSALPGVARTKTDSPGQGWMVRATSTLTPSLLNEAGWSFSSGAIVSRPTGAINATASPDIKANLPFASTLGRVPALSVGGLSSITGYGPYDDFNRNHNIFDNLTKVMSKHTLKVGVSLNFYQKTENAAGNNAGAFSFATTPRPAGTSTAEQGWANFLLGNVATFTQASRDITPDMRARQGEAYVQDDYRVKRNFTVNLGLRYSLFRQPYDANHLLTNFDPSRWDAAKAPLINAANGNIVPNTGDPLNGIIVNGDTSPYGAKVAGEKYNNFAPRLGFAWDPFKKGKTAIRSGYGISYDSTLVGTFEQNVFNNPPFVNNITISNTRLENPAARVQVISAAPKTLRGTPLPAQTPYTQQWSFDAQQEIRKGLVMTVGYYGSKSTHLLGIVDLNSVRPGAGVAAGILSGPATTATTPLLNALRPYRGYGPINSVQNWFNSNYHSLQVSAQRAFSRRSSLRLSYTYSKALTDAGSDRSNAPQNFYNRAADYARAPFDRTQVLTISYIYQLPFRTVLLKGWQFSGIVAANTGLPLRVTSGYGLDWAGLGVLGTSAVSLRPDRVSDPNLNAPHTIAKWFNTESFAPVPDGELRPGNAAATTVAGPGAARLDFSLFRTVPLRELAKLQIRVEAFNVTNHTNYGAVSTSAGSTTFGQITSARDPRRLQLGMKLIF